MKIYKGLLTNNEIKRINSLSRKKERTAQGIFIVEGNKNVQEVLNSRYQVKQIYGIDDSFHSSPNFTRINQKQLERISQYKTASEALAIVELPDSVTIDYKTPSIVLEDISDPGNLGTIIRTADWFGIKQVICSLHSVDCYNPKVVSSTKGSLFRTNVVYTDLIDFISASSLPAVATSLAGEDLNSTINLANHNYVFGSESHGISKDLEEACSKSIRIPSFNSQPNP